MGVDRRLKQKSDKYNNNVTKRGVVNKAKEEKTEEKVGCSLLALVGTAA